MEAHVPLAVVLSVVGVAAVVVGWLAARSHRDQQPTRSPVLRGVGGALALALDGDLAAAAGLIEAEVRRGGASPEHLLAWVALLRARGRTAEAAALVARLGHRRDAPWLAAMQVRLALDLGDVVGAADRALAPGVPVDLAVAAMMRAGRWTEAKALYLDRVSKRDRSDRVLGTIEAGLAGAEARRGEARAARKTIKRALTHAADSAAAQAVAARIHPKDDTRARLSQALHTPGRHTPAPSEVDGGAGGVLDAARAAFEAGQAELALGLLRDRLDGAPQDHAARLLYGRWILEHGEPADWRTELADLLDGVVPERTTPSWRCGRCTVVVPERVFVCPRCDSLEPMEPIAASGIQAEVALEGARVVDLTRDLPDPGLDGAR